MKKLVSFAAAAALVAGFGLASAPAQAVCNTGPTSGVDAGTLPDGGVVYTFGNNVGLRGSHGYIEAGDAGVQGNSTDAPLEGKLSPSGSICINGTTAP
jgi:hypothetical protein